MNLFRIFLLAVFLLKCMTIVLADASVNSNGTADFISSAQSSNGEIVGLDIGVIKKSGILPLGSIEQNQKTLRNIFSENALIIGFGLLVGFIIVVGISFLLFRKRLSVEDLKYQTEHTVREYIEKILKNKDKHLKLALDLDNIAQWNWNFQTGEFYFDKRCAQILEDKDQGIKNYVSSWQELIHPEDVDRFEHNLKDLIDNKTDSFRIRHRLVTKNGICKWVISSVLVSDRDEKNKPYHITLMMKEITDYLRSEDKSEKQKLSLIDLDNRLHKSLKEQEKVSDELDVFLYTVSHDLRTPLGIIISYINLIESEHKDKLDGELAHLLARVCKNVNILDCLIKDMVALSSTFRSKMEFADTDMRELIETKIGKMEFDKNQVAFEISKELPSICCDASTVDDLFSHLIGNAVKFSSRVKSQKTLVEIGYFLNEEFHQFYIRDNGIGIGAEYHKKIFNLFEKLHPDNHYEGTGIGLSIVKKIVELHDGEIWVDSASGEGATFYFTISKNLSTDSVNDVL